MTSCSCADITPPTSLAPATHPRFGVVCHCQTRPLLRWERLLYRSLRKKTLHGAFRFFSAWTQPNELPTYYRTLPGTVVATHGAPLAASLTRDSV